MEEFSQGQSLRVINYVESSPQGVTLRRAMGRLGEQDYNLLFNNCEHFATWCKTGRHRSGQVDSCLLYTSPSPRDRTRSRMPSSA